jgi:hypothetical protein
MNIAKILNFFYFFYYHIKPFVIKILLGSGQIKFGSSKSQLARQILN